MKKAQENEIKLVVPGARQTRSLLKRRGFQVLHARIFEKNIVLDDAQGSVKGRNLLLRVRVAGKTITCTFKGKEIPGPHKRREEREFHADNLEECLAVFRGIGFQQAYVYEKYRTEFAREGEPGLIMLDETPIGVFLEIEGPARWIDQTAAELGFARTDYVNASYWRLFEAWCRERGIEPRDMVFQRV